MTVYRDVEAARIPPHVLKSNDLSCIPAHLRQWFRDAYQLYHNEEVSYAYKAGYFYGLLTLIEHHFQEAEATKQT